MRYFPPKGTAGLARSRVSGWRRVPSPPAITIPRIFGLIPGSFLRCYRPGSVIIVLYACRILCSVVSEFYCIVSTSQAQSMLDMVREESMKTLRTCHAPGSPTMERYICVHGHFYQPPRQNPWLEAIELQDSAHPYHDWNERITAECYTPNTAARILDSADRIVRIVNNYTSMSFNFGPTLLAWLAQQTPEVYAAIVAADHASQVRFAGHGSALAQAYNHMILPLANRRDKYTQILWGIRDFVHRFRRQPEGLWLPETAVDLETLDLMTEVGLHFTILSPTQACRVRALSDGAWHDVSGGQIDPTMPYVQRLPSGRQITVFFYHAAISRGIAFERLLSNGQELVDQLVGALRAQQAGPQLVHVATD